MLSSRSPSAPAKTVLTSLVLLMTCVFSGCADSHDPAQAPDARQASAETDSAEKKTMHDTHSYSRPDEAVVEHLDLDVRVDFAIQKIIGRASLHINNRTGGANLYLDTRDLDITSVFLDDALEPTTHAMSEADPFLGSELKIAIEPTTRVVHIDYSSRPEAAAVQWLTPAQTTGGEHPFLFTQSQAILARTWIPCQDSPAVRFTYNATVQVPKTLMAVMSAENQTGKSDDGIYHFEMPQPIPSYLLALAVGDLEFRPLGERSGVYAEPGVVESAAYEFAETETMMAAVEKLYGPYRWGRYDILVLPPSFPFGGMENPRLTFATPTILAGDRSLVSLVAHELAHSWSGNLVTNATWNDFWLNEGFTVYLERRIMEALHGRPYATMLTALGRQDLEQQIEQLGKASRDTHLFLDLAERDPDDGMTDIAYEKGYFFLRTLEEAVGRERFDTFLASYFERNAFKSLTTSLFVEQLNSHLLAEDPGLAAEISLEEWIYGPGLPANAVTVESEAFDKVEAQLAAWSGGGAATDLAVNTWTTHEWLHFLRALPSEMTDAQMADLDAAFKFTGSGNSEIRHAWLHHVIANAYEPGYASLEGFLTGMGRRKFLQPLYARLAETPEGLERAKSLYAVARPSYHAVSTATLDEILGWQG